MTTSNSIAWELTRDQIISSAYRKLGVLGLDQTASATQVTNGAEALNSVVAHLVTKGMPLWKRQTQTFTPSATSQIFTIVGAEKVVQVTLYDTTTKYPLVEKSLYDFNSLPVGVTGVPVHYTYQPTIPQGGTLSIWPQLSDAGTIAAKTIGVVIQKQFDGFTAAGETLDFPSYWTLTIILALCLALAPETGLPLNDRGFLNNQYMQALADCIGYGDEDGSLFLQPDKMGM